MFFLPYLYCMQSYRSTVGFIVPYEELGTLGN